MKKHERARRLAEAMSVWIYSPPKKLNDLFLKWLNTHDVPTYREIQDAMRDQPPNVQIEGLAATSPERGEKVEQRIDDALDSVLRASGSALKFYTMPLTLDRMREAMRNVMSESYITGSNDNFNAMKNNRP
jgi:hypothetical protein